jgi:hypothetical protein
MATATPGIFWRSISARTNASTRSLSLPRHPEIEAASNNTAKAHP